MDDDLCSRRGERCGVVIELPMQLCIPGKFGVHARLSEQVECEDGVWDKLAPDMVERDSYCVRKPQHSMSLFLLLSW